MRFGRAKTTIEAERPMPAQAHDLNTGVNFSPVSDAPLLDLYVEAKRRGFAMVPIGAWEHLTGELEAAEVAVAAAAEREANLVDRTQEVQICSAIAGEFPRVVAENSEIWRERSAFRDRAVRAESEAELLTAALLGPELAALEHGTPTDDNNEDPER
jgi:hypothetical protein